MPKNKWRTKVSENKPKKEISIIESSFLLIYSDIKFIPFLKTIGYNLFCLTILWSIKLLMFKSSKLGSFIMRSVFKP